VSVWQNAGVIFATLVGFLALIGTTCAALVKAGRFIARTGRLLDQLLGHGEGPDRVPGLIERVNGMGDELTRVKAQVLPNGGGSLRDAVDELRKRFDDYVTRDEGGP